MSQLASVNKVIALKLFKNPNHTSYLKGQEKHLTRIAKDSLLQKTQLIHLHPIMSHKKIIDFHSTLLHKKEGSDNVPWFGNLNFEILIRVRKYIVA